ncbi:HEAT repeat-containing protein 1 [Geranomyces variabilis]|uniref:U3 small nucleolar RNA-associated protein 10 n=1 Tax=Geranomyces variabilis TaxID=109894 RepID=A0AAD5TTR7_9FUNG|nr:HEAT repeat-containing protein 1 [Geranomyces variabilis]
MASSLSSQLKQLGAAKVPVAPKGKASLLFTAKQAADIDIDSLFAIGRTALAELATHNPAFADFDQTLFSESFKSFDRTLQTKEDNAKLDQSIARFLRLLSPHFLLQSCFKALEWLLRRFRINEYNIDLLMECVLPYHETKQFVQVVGVLALPDASHWQFLRGVQKTKVPLDRTSLVQRLGNDKFLLEFLCEMVASSKAMGITNRTLWTFFACTILQYVQDLHTVSDEDLRILLAPLLALLRLGRPQYADLLASAQMIFAQIANRCPLQDEILSAIFSNATADITSANIPSIVIFLLTLHRSQTIEAIPSKPFALLLFNKSFEAAVIQTCLTYESETFVNSLFSSSIAAIREREKVADLAVHLVQELLKDVRPSFESIGLLANGILDAYLDTHDEGTVSECKDSLMSILASIQRSSPGVADKVLEARLATEDDSTKKTLYEFINTTYQGTGGAMMEDAGTTLYLSLEHVDASIRLMALKKLQELLASGQYKDVDFVEDTLLNRMQDDDDEILKLVLGLSRLTELVGSDKLLPALQNVLRSSTASSQNKIMAFDLCAELALNADAEDTTSPKLDLFTCFLLNKANRALNKHAFASAEKKSVFGDVVTGCGKLAAEIGKVDDKTAAETLARVITVLAGNVTAARVPFYVAGLSAPSPLTRTLCGLVLAQALSAKSADVVTQIIDAAMPVFLHRLRALRSAVGNAQPRVTDAANGLPSAAILNDVTRIKGADQSSAVLETEILLSAIQTIVTVYEKPAAAPIAWMCTAMDADQDVARYRNVINNVYEGVASLGSYKACDAIILDIIERHLGRETVQFCAAQWTKSTSPAHIKHHGLVVAAAYVNACADPAVITHYDFQLLIPSALIALGDANKEVRSSALACLAAIASTFGKIPAEVKPKGKKKAAASHVQIFAYDQFYGNGSEKVQYLTSEAAGKFVGDLLEGKEELLTDSEFLKRFMHDVLLVKGPKKSGYKEDVLSFLLSNILALPAVDAQIKLLNILEGVDSSSKIKTLHPLLEDSLKSVSSALLHSTASAQPLQLISALVRSFTPAVNVSLFSMRNDKYARLLCDMLTPIDTSDESLSATHEAAVQRLALTQISNQWFVDIPIDRQTEFFSAIVRLAYEGETTVVQDAKNLLKTLQVSWELVLAQLQICNAALRATEERPAKKTSKDSKELTNAFYRLSTVLEMMEYKHDVAGKHNLVGPLFDLLSNILNAEISSIPVSVEYVKQLIFSVTLALFKDIKDNGLQIDESTLRVELIVQCLRVTDNPQTHSSALLLMATIATVFPESVLLNIMPVFTFMGANVLRQDDNYSFHVIQQTLKTVIPPLVQRYEGADGSHNSMLREVKPIIGVFVDALSHIPKHRRLRLFTELVSTLGADAFLDATVLMLIAKHSSKNKLPAHGVDGLVEFTLSLVAQFPVQTQLSAITSMIETVSGLPLEQSDIGSEDSMDMDETGVIDSKTCSAKDLRQIKLSTVDFINQLLGSKPFVTSALALSQEEIESDQLVLIQETLVFITNMNAYQVASEGRSHAVGVKFAKAMNKLLYEVLGRANGLLSLSSFLTVTSRLMKHENHAIRRKAITLLDAKVSAVAKDIDASNLAQFATVVGDLRAVLVASTADGDSEMLENKQTALLCLTTMARIMAKSDPETYIAVLKILVGKDALLNHNAQIVASTMVCLTAICTELGSRVLPYLPKFMPGIISNLGTALSGKGASETRMLVILGSLGSLDALVDTVPQFVSPYVLPIIQEALHPSLLATGGEQGVGRKAADKSNELLSNMAAKIAPRILLPAIFAHLKTSLGAGRASMLALFSLVGEAINHMPRTELTQYRTDLFRFFLVSFDYRRNLASTVDEADIEAVENGIISAFLQLVMKLNETLFKPLFLKMVDWATSELLMKHGLTQQDVDARQLFFYRLVDSLLARLKSIFAPYYAYVLDSSIAKLEAYKVSRRTDALWTNIMLSLHKCFLYDNDGMIDADKFDKLLQPLVGQLDSLDPSDKRYETSVSAYLVPCIGQLAVTVGKDSLWKPLNHQILMKTRHEDPAVRLAALRVLQELYSRLGEEMLILFPETIPFLAELMEDTDGEVEAACQNVCAQIQQYIGEDIQQYFTA